MKKTYDDRSLARKRAFDTIDQMARNNIIQHLAQMVFVLLYFFAMMLNTHAKCTL